MFQLVLGKINGMVITDDLREELNQVAAATSQAYAGARALIPCKLVHFPSNVLFSFMWWNPMNIIISQFKKLASYFPPIDLKQFFNFFQFIKIFF